MILVIGGTGTVGSEVLSALGRADTKGVRALVRSPERADSLRGLDVECVLGDLADPASLEPAFRGVDAVFLATPAGPGQEELEGNAVAAAATVGAHLVKLSVLGAGAGSPLALGRSHGRIEQRARDAGVRSTFLRPNGFLQNLLASAADVQERGELRAPLGEAAVSLVDTRDVADVAVHALTRGGHADAAYPLTGPTALTWTDIAQAIGRHAGRPVRYVDEPEQDTRSRLTAAGVPDELADGLLELYRFYRGGAGGEVSDEVTKATGRSARSLEDFLTSYGSAFAAA